MYKISEIHIDGFQGNKKPLKIEFNPDVNFVIGRNGTGKTRLINLINALMSANVRGFSSSTFNIVSMRLEDPEHSRRVTIEVTKQKKESGENQIVYAFKASDRRKNINVQA